MPGRLLIAALALACAVTVAGCGSDDGGTIPPEDADRMLSLLDGIEENVAARNCELATKQSEELIDSIDMLPAAVGTETKGAMREAANQLVALSDDPDQCEETTGATGIEEIEPTTTTSAPPETTTQTTTEQTTEPEDDEDGDDGSGGGSQGGGGSPGGGGGGSPGGGGGGGSGDVTIEPPADDDPTSGGIGGDKGPGR